MTIPPEPRAVRWYFEHRKAADIGLGYTAEQIEYNDRLWLAVAGGGIEAGEVFVNTATPEPCVNASASQDRHSDGYMRDYMRTYRAEKKRAAQRPP